ncbi:MAG TPA: PilZ domain-containing protein [Polyangiaceae bacterium]|nr:PilZ domain-containing protein [Polyangiaceae bacterium]
MTNSADPRDKQTLGNRRAHRRAALTAPVLVDSARAHHTGYCRDVSEGGLSIELQGDLPVGTAVDLYFELPTGIAIEARAEIARRAERTFGLRFQSLSADDRRAVVAYCETWKAALLTKCAHRMASIPSTRIVPSELSKAPDSQGTAATFDSTEANSGVRIRAAEAWRGPGTSSKSG